MSHCGIIGGEELALLGDLELLVEMAGRWRPPSAFGMWGILWFVDLVILDYFFKYLVAKTSRCVSLCASHGELIDAEKPVQFESVSR